MASFAGPLDVCLTEEHGVAVAVVRGEVDILTAAELRRGLEAAGDSGGTAVVVDLSELAFIELTGLRVLLDAQADLRRRGIVLAVASGENGPSAMLLEATGHADALWVLEDRAAAVEAVRAVSPSLRTS